VGQILWNKGFFLSQPNLFKWLKQKLRHGRSRDLETGTYDSLGKHFEFKKNCVSHFFWMLNVNIFGTKLFKRVKNKLELNWSPSSTEASVGCWEKSSSKMFSKNVTFSTKSLKQNLITDNNSRGEQPLKYRSVMIHTNRPKPLTHTHTHTKRHTHHIHFVILEMSCAASSFLGWRAVACISLLRYVNS